MNIFVFIRNKRVYKPKYLMQLVEKHTINQNNSYFKEIDNLCFLSKNLYNYALYTIRQAYINDKTNVINNIYYLVKEGPDYKALPAKISASILIMIQQNFKSYFKALAEYKKNPQKFIGRPQLPKYLHKTDGRFVVPYTNQAISKKIFNKTGKIKLSQCNIEFNTKIKNFEQIDCVRLVPKPEHNCYVIELVYTIKDTDKLFDNNKYLSLDLGLNNLATITSNVKDIDPLIINGKPLKSINQYYNKQKAYYQSILEKRQNKKTSKRLKKLSLKRKNKIDNYLHKASKQIIEICKEQNINTIIVGKNDNWKQDINLGTKNNQGFVNIPHSRFIEMISYKCEISGINIILQEESYTSKASFLSLDKIPKFSKKDKEEHVFSGYRESRGMYKLKSQPVRINADVNGSYNILRKAVPNAFANGIEGLEVNPKVITLKK